jgi:hypothetical protein
MSKYIRDMQIFDKNIEYVRTLIPELSRVNFDRNLCYLKIFVDKKHKYFLGQYLIKYNIIALSKREIIDEKEKLQDEFPIFINYIMEHELLQVASNRFDKKRNIRYSGFSKIYESDVEKEKSQMYFNLDEGFISFLLSKDYKYNQAYTLQNYFVAQLTEVVGLDLMKDAFFNNKGIKPIKDKLRSLNISEDNIETFLKSFERIETVSFTIASTSLIPKIQNLLIDFYSKKIDSVNNIEEVNELKSNFSKIVENTMNFGIDQASNIFPVVRHLCPIIFSKSIDKQ